jgi:hypothetical protein
MNTVVHLTLGALFAAAVSAALAGPLPPPPAGSKVINTALPQMKAQGIADGIEVEKENDNFPHECSSVSTLRLGYGWQVLPGGDKVVDMMAQAPEDPASEHMGVRDEPAGKKRYLDGVLTWRKSTMTVIGTSESGCKLKEIVSYDGTWTAYIAGKIVGVHAFRVYGSKDAGQALIDDYAAKMKTAVAAGN